MCFRQPVTLIGLEWFNRDWLDADIALPYTEALVLLLSLSCAPLPVQFPAIGTQPLATELIIFYSFFVLPALITMLSHFDLLRSRVPVFPEILFVLPGLKNWALIAHIGLVFEVLLYLGLDLLVLQGTFPVLGPADLSLNKTPHKEVGLAENLVFSRFFLVSDKAEGLGLCPARHKPEPSHLPKPLEIFQKILFGGVLW